jgi:hypothetical protein
VTNPEEKRVVMGIVQEYTGQPYNSSYHRMSYNKGHEFPQVHVTCLYQ